MCSSDLIHGIFEELYGLDEEDASYQAIKEDLHDAMSRSMAELGTDLENYRYGTGPGRIGELEASYKEIADAFDDLHKALQAVVDSSDHAAALELAKTAIGAINPNHDKGDLPF